MKKLIIFLIILFSVSHAFSQRKMEFLDRGVVVVNKGNQLFVSWRYFATDPEDIAFNVYRQIGTGTPLKLNNSPITGATNFTWNVSGAGLSFASRVYVKPVLNGVEGDEGGSWDLNANHPKGRIVRDYDFEPFPTGYPKMSMKFCWPADLNGDGKYDFIIDRHPTGDFADDSEDEVGDVDTSAPSAHIDAYKEDGSFMWRIKMGHNVVTSAGHSDMVTAYDLDGDNKAEVIMAVSEGTSFADGTTITGENGLVTDYNQLPGSAPQWVAVVNGETGHLIDKVPLPLFDEIKSDRTDKWRHISGHMVIAYLDGIHPSVIYHYKTRLQTGAFFGACAAWRLIDGKLVEQWANLFYPEQNGSEFHQIRVADVDGDGKDEFLEGGYTLDDDGSLLHCPPNVGHGDRHCVADIDPDRPGLEHFFIQQSNIMGMGLYDAATGEMIKGLYMASVADVGRGVCAALDPNIRGMQFYSTMFNNALYDSKGNLIPNAKGSFPHEALWWGGDLSRRIASSAGSDKNPTIDQYSTSSKSIGRSISLYRASESGAPKDYYFRAPNGGRAAFWGDILGDWREELIYTRTDNTGFVILSTWDETNHRQYCLMQNPAYRGQTTAKGYYQTADVDFYMATDMPLPPVAPVQTADIYIKNDNSINSSVNGKSAMLDIRNNNNDITIQGSISPSKLWLMNPKGKNHRISGGKISGETELVKSMQGDITLVGDHDYTGVTRVSEGRLFVDGSLDSPVRVDARGVIGGNVNLKGGIILEEGLNVEGGRIEPGNQDGLGTMSIVGSVTLPNRNNLAFKLNQNESAKSDQLIIDGDLILQGGNHSIIVNQISSAQSGVVTLIQFTGTTNATSESFKVRGLEGVPYELIVEEHAIKLELVEPRQAAHVVWTGNESDLWDFKAENFKKGVEGSLFVPNDRVSFDDQATEYNITLNETMPVDELLFSNNKDYRIQGLGVIAGNGKLIKTGSGKVSILNEENIFSGGVDFSDGVLEVRSLKDGDLPSSIGAASGAASNWIMRNATLQTAGQMATNRDMLVEGKLTVDNPASNNSVMISGNITGDDIHLELTGAGTLNLQGANNFKSVVLKSGTLALGSVDANNVALGDGTVTIEDAVLQMRDVNSMSYVGPWKNTIHVPEGKSAKWNLPSRWNFTNKLTGKGEIVVNAPYFRNDFRGDWSGFEGELKIDGRDFRIDNNFGFERAALNLVGSGVSFFHLSEKRTIKIGSLSGVAGSRLAGNNTTWEIGNRNDTTQFNGSIVGTGSKLTKKGTGLLALAGSNTYTGLTDVVSGTLLVVNSEGSATGSNNVTVRTGASFGGNGKIDGNLSIYANSYLDLVNNKNETLSIGGDLSFANNSTIRVDVNSSTGKSDMVKATNVSLINCRLEVEGIVNVQDIQPDTSFKIFEVEGSLTGVFAQISPELPEGLGWDQSKLSEGIVTVAHSTAVPNLYEGDKIIKSIRYYTTSGVQTNENSTGVVILHIEYIDGSISVEKKFKKQ